MEALDDEVFGFAKEDYEVSPPADPVPFEPSGSAQEDYEVSPSADPVQFDPMKFHLTSKFAFPLGQGRALQRETSECKILPSTGAKSAPPEPPVQVHAHAPPGAKAPPEPPFGKRKALNIATHAQMQKFFKKK